MIATSALVMLRGLGRDRAALLLSFVLPPILFVVFAAIFATASGTGLAIKVGVADLARTADSARLVQALAAEPALRFTAVEAADEAALAEAVRRGRADAGLLIRGDPRRRPDEGPPPLLVLESPAQPLAGAIAAGQIQRTLSEKLPDVVLGRILADVEAAGAIGADERAYLDRAFRTEAAERQNAPFSFAAAVERRVAQGGAGDPVLYYAGAVVAVFMLFAAVHGALTLIDERRSGIVERLAAGRRGLSALVAGKFVFLVGQGAAQAALVFLAARLLYGASIGPGRLGPWGLTVLLAAACAAGLALSACALCRSRKQAEVLTTFGVLLVSALGGSMVPRYLMPPTLQSLGVLTPNAWIIEAFEAAVEPAAGLRDLGLPWLVLAALAAAGLVGAVAVTRRRLY